MKSTSAPPLQKQNPGYKMMRYYVTTPPREKVLSQFGCYDCRVSFRGRLGWGKIVKHARIKHSESLVAKADGFVVAGKNV